MSKISISKRKYKFLNENLHIYKNKNIITTNQYNQIKDLYSVKYTNPIQIFTILGSILIGLGIIVYIGSEWRNLDNIMKLLIIIFAYLLTNYISYKTSKKYNKTSKSILYLGVIIYGAGVMLTQDMFNYNISFLPSGILWVLGMLPTIYIFEEKLIYIFACILTFIFSFSYINTYPYMVILVYSVIFIINIKIFKDFKLGILARDVVLYSLIPQYLNLFGVENIYIFVIMIAIGIGIRYYNFKENKWMYELQGLVLIAIFGMNLTFSYTWEVLLNNNVSQLIAYGVGFSYFVYFMYESVKGNLICVLPIIALVIRYFSDSFILAFSKSLLFIIVGGILLVIGFFIEKNISEKGRK